ncbi:alpha-L-fucosidase-like [Centruroides sculpturatus]|uniref:alpha-L-fucosidase-like n=1 Tax=Centruroides sculpturatus TaxID=218467 RepID=UPI000C6E2BDD|nr:alpha-L-fucosidase-like [Centruroides sculpturatus]
MLLRLCSLFLLIFLVTADYQPNWKSIDSRPIPEWYDKSKIGIFLHWGLFSVPSFGSEWFWMNWVGTKIPQYVEFMKKNYRPNFTYPDFGPSFTAEFYDPDQWAEIFNASGARYVVLTSKHHEGFTMWPSKFSWNWNAKDLGPNRDLLGDLAKAVRKYDHIHFGLYHSLMDWFHPLYLKDKNNSWATDYFVRVKAMPELYELVTTYKPEIIWSDGDWEAPYTYWNSTGFLAWLYNKSPVKDVIAVNDRWGSGMACHHGGYFTCQDRYNPGKLQPRKWENAMTLDYSSWGYRRNAQIKDIMPIQTIIATLAETISCGGNILINIGPTHDGRIIPVFEERLRQLGSWLKVNGEAIYESQPWIYQNDTITPNIWYTSKENSVYAIVLNWPKKNLLTLGAVNLQEDATVYMLGWKNSLNWKSIGRKGTQIMFPSLTPDLLPSQWAWVVKINQD